MAREALQTGATIDGYLIGEKLHTGGMATLWQVTHPDIKTPIVMKVPMIMDGDDATVIVGFEMEMMILPRLNGQYVPRCHAVGDYARQPYLVMDQIDGDSLFPKLEQSPLQIDEVIAIGSKVATALVDLHRQNVIHLDIKPSNIMMDKAGHAVFIDFGLSRHLNLPDLLEEEFHVPMGTGPYISPEQVLQNRTDPRSDIFSLGVILYHLTTGHRPFGFPQNNRGLRRRLWRDPIPPRKHNADCPPWLQEVILRCLEPDPARRYPTAAQLAFDLQHPAEMKLTERSSRRNRDGLLSVMKRRMGLAGTVGAPRQPDLTLTTGSPIIMAAVDLSEDQQMLAETVRTQVGRVMSTTPGVRLACVNVFKQNRVAINYSLDDEGRNIHVQRLVELKEWARPLALDLEHISFHVLEHVDPAAALIEYARTNHVDHVLIGARGLGGLRRMLGSVSSQFVAEAPCTVTVVRLQQSEARELAAE